MVDTPVTIREYNEEQVRATQETKDFQIASSSVWNNLPWNAQKIDTDSNGF